MLPLTATPRGLSIGGIQRLSIGSLSCGALMKIRPLNMPSWRTVYNAGSSIGSLPRSYNSIAVLNGHFCPRRSICAIGARVYRKIGECCLTLASVCRRGLVRRVDSVQHRFLFHRQNALEQRICKRSIVDGHGDLRPEHIWLGDPVRIIDCLEFNPHLRTVDPFDEIAFLSVECDRLGAGWASKYITASYHAWLARRAVRGVVLVLSLPPRDVACTFGNCASAGTKSTHAG